MKRIAVIGAGISGLAAAYLLSRRYEVSLFEREPRVGGHTHTIRVRGERETIALDTGFLVHNARTYPNLVRLFDEVGVATRPSDMSFSVSCSTSGFEYSSRGALGFFAQPQNVFNTNHYRLLRDIIRFNREAPDMLGADGARQWTLDTYVRERGYGDAFVTRYLVPMTSAIWSASIVAIRAFPMETLVRFMQNHGMLSLGSAVTWQVVCGGSDRYVGPLIQPLGDRVHRSTPPTAVVRHHDAVSLRFADQRERRFDHVVFACHGDQVLPLLADATDDERDVFSTFRTTANQTVLHTDASLLPAAPRARASWNYRLEGRPEQPPMVTYDLNRLQGLDERTQYCVSLNPSRTPAAHTILARMTYRHPQFTRRSESAQAQWRVVSGVNRTHYCGAYWRYGFHEDGLMSAMRVAADLGVSW